MFVFETCVFLLFVGGCCLWSLIRDAWQARRDRKQAQHVGVFTKSLVGQELSVMESRFGPPFETVLGHYDKNLYVWKAPPSDKFPAFRGTLVVTVTANQGGEVLEAVWRRQ